MKKIRRIGHFAGCFFVLVVNRSNCRMAISKKFSTFAAQFEA